ncbi:hypothetical protein Ahy_B07g086431 isoform A [Arachis hypogaea]|uniref:J domain-containing protein n=1 Tax=Arachis hypogaea TaxID=3818 RepID=A0A444Y9P2_ARAHY|nr:hypothetical protein Ahy_B07g086431 isoform A [Arachis hypogaea]
MQTATRAEAERLLGIAEKLLHTRDLNGSREFAILAQETEPLLEGSDQILAIVDVLLAADNRPNAATSHPHHHQLDWYGILQVDRRTNDLDLIKRNYRRLALLLHPDKSRFAYADHAFKLVADAWAVLSDPIKKSNYDKQRQGQNRSGNFWTACPYCYRLYEYPRVYEGCCLRCQNCDRSFHGISIPSLPPLVPGQDAYYCCWGFFPMGFVVGNVENGGNVSVPVAAPTPARVAARGSISNGVAGSGPRKRGRPRKYPLQS